MSELSPARIAIVAALEREVRPLVKGWEVRECIHDGRRFRFFQKADIVVVCGGIGAEAVRHAAEVAIDLYTPAVLYSAGFAGALDPALKIGDVVHPERVIDASDGSSITINSGSGILVTFGAVASPTQKSRLREAYGAQLVDMEAAAVARAAELRGVAFAVVKAISDECDFEIPPMEKFVNFEGEFLEFSFALYAMLSPWLWSRIIQLARNSGIASRALCDDLRNIGAQVSALAAR